ncbi:MAG: A/G-specific adenine glycosylase [Candidatus Cloacimonetes bacterium 4572_55]|nr:MAG: A/G-specific adenine glycosylase [Candidatus Cloacimonetes bacterium 4572_55]
MSGSKFFFFKIHGNLYAWFDRYKRDLPWRKTDNPYHIWVSEAMLQQTQVVKVLDYYDRFIDAFPDIERLARSDLQDALKIWEGMGYYGRVRNLHKAAQILARQGNEVPADYKAFRKLPGVGDYIASAVLSFAFKMPYPALDCNIKRVVSRLFLVSNPVNQTSSKKIFEKKIRLIFDEQNPRLFNQAIMELGALVCRPSKPRCADCPISFSCQAYRDNVQENYPVSIPRKKRPLRHLAAAIILKENRVLIVRRPLDGLLGGLWEFPNGEIESDERSELACIRLAKTALDLTVEPFEELGKIRHGYTHFKIVVAGFCCEYIQGEPPEAIDFQWVRPDDISKFPFPKAHLKLFELFRASHPKQLFFDKM